VTQLETELFANQRSPSERLDLDALPGPDPMRFFGWRGNIVRCYLDIVGCLDEVVAGGHGDVVTFVRGLRSGLIRPFEDSPGAVLMFDPSIVQQVLSQPATFTESVILSTPNVSRDVALLTSGLAFMPSKHHRKHRRIIMPFYHHKRIDGYGGVLARATERAIERWRPGAWIDVYDEGGRILSDFQREAILGIDDVERGMSYAAQIIRFYEWFMNPATYIPLNIPGTPRAHMFKDGAQLVTALRALVAEKRKASGATDFVTTLIEGRDEHGGALTEEEIVGEAAHLFMSGWVSPRASLGWILFLLAQHPDVAADLHDELTSVLRGSAPTVEQLRRLPLLEGVVKEALRLFPPVFTLARMPNTAVEIKGYRIPARTEILLSIYHTHRIAEIYDEPRRFRPERWSSIDPGPYAYLPFSLGPRTCPGLALSMLELKVIVAMISQRFRLELPRPAKLDRYGYSVLSIKQGLRMRVRPQDRCFAKSRSDVRGNIATMIDIDN
jgi:cytochrome P450